MVDITHKSNTLRKAIASARIVVSRPETMDAVKNKKVPKGDVFEFSRAAGLLAIKKTSDVIPDCHPLPVEFASIKFETDSSSIKIFTEVWTIYKTGVEVEAMHGAAITALTIYDMLKPLDPGVKIETIQLESKTGGKSGLKADSIIDLKCVVVICSDTISAGTKSDKTGKLLQDKLAQLNIEAALEIIPDEFSIIQEKAIQHANDGVSILIFSGGTGLSRRDVTPDAIKPLLEKEAPGIMEAARAYGQQRTPFAMLSRGVAGFIKHTLVLTLPGSPQGALETIEALFPHVLHALKVAEGIRHDNPASA